MDEKNNKSLIILILVLIILVMGGFGYYFYSKEPTAPSELPYYKEGKTRESQLPSGIIVPNPGEEVPENVALPKKVMPAGPSSASKLRIFELTVSKEGFVPDTVIVAHNDTVRMDITALDSDYVVVQPDYGFRQDILQGQTKSIEFQATDPGRYLIFCPSCGGPDKGPKSEIIIVEE